MASHRPGAPTIPVENGPRMQQINRRERVAVCATVCYNNNLGYKRSDRVDLGATPSVSNSSDRPRNKKFVSLASLQRVEKIFGSIICALLHLPALFIPKTVNMAPNHVRKLLVVKFFGIGSLVLATPFFREARKIFPHAEIHLLTLSGNREIARMLPHVDQVHYVNLGSNVFEAVRRYVGCLAESLKGRYDVLIDMEFYTRASAVVSLASWAPIRIGYHSRGVYRGNIQSHRVPFNVYWHVSRNFLSLLEPFGYEATGDIPLPMIKLAEQPLEPTIQLLNRLARWHQVYRRQCQRGRVGF